MGREEEREGEGVREGLVRLGGVGCFLALRRDGRPWPYRL